MTLRARDGLSLLQAGLANEMGLNDCFYYFSLFNFVQSASKITSHALYNLHFAHRGL